MNNHFVLFEYFFS